MNKDFDKRNFTMAEIIDSFMQFKNESNIALPRFHASYNECYVGGYNKGWNAAIESMQSELDKRDALLSKCLVVLTEVDDQRYDDLKCSTSNKVEDLINEIEQLNGVKDE